MESIAAKQHTASNSSRRAGVLSDADDGEGDGATGSVRERSDRVANTLPKKVFDDGAAVVGAAGRETAFSAAESVRQILARLGRRCSKVAAGRSEDEASESPAFCSAAFFAISFSFTTARRASM